MSYSDKVVDHYNNPRNVGTLDKTSTEVGTGLVGAPECGDVMRLQIRVNPDTQVIEEAKFKTFGCGSAIASSSLATEWVKGMTIDQSMAIENTQIGAELKRIQSASERELKAAKALGVDIDYRRLLANFQNRGSLVRAYYYTAMIEDQEYSSIRPLIDWLNYNGYTVVTKATKEFVDASGRRKVKGSMDIELAVDAMELMEHIDQMVLFSGDGVFRSLVAAVQRRGVHVTVVSTIATQPPMIADDLRRQTDVFIDLREFQPKISRDPPERLPE